ncbi:hypothetical protein ACO0RG_002482 [Hanseniaspora osmophila]
MSEQPNNVTEGDKSRIKELYRGDTMTKSISKVDRKLLDAKHTENEDELEKLKPKSLNGEVTMRSMGSALQQDASMKRTAYATYSSSLRSTTEHRRQSKSNAHRKEEKKEKEEEEEEVFLSYYPSNNNSQEVYDQIMHWVLVHLFDNDATHTAVLTTVDYLLKELLGEQKADEEFEQRTAAKKARIEAELGVRFKNDTFHQLLDMVKQITDYGKKHDRGTEIAAIVDFSDYDKEEEDEEGDEVVHLDDKQLGRTYTEGKEDANNNEIEFDFDEESEEELIPTAELQEKQRNATVETANVEYFEALGSFHDMSKPHIERFLLANLNRVDVAELTDKTITIIAQSSNEQETEKRLTEIYAFDEIPIVQTLLQYRLNIKWGLKYAEAKEKEVVLTEMHQLGLDHLLTQHSKKRANENLDGDEGPLSKKLRHRIPTSKLRIIDLGSFKVEPVKTINTKVQLPKNSYKKIKDHYEEIHIPAPDPLNDSYPLVQIDELPKWALRAFPQSETRTLNRIQSEVFPAAFHNDFNILLCAPTGAGKTNVAMLTILRALAHFVDEETGNVDLSKVKIVYIAPLKALVQEQVREFGRRLDYLGVKVVELTGDSNMTRAEIKSAHILVSTPEKWDVITRKSSNFKLTSTVRLIIIDEVHLLHDERGPVIESIVSRAAHFKTRLVALSATLPNYTDVAHFLNVEKGKGMFFFDSTFRPCPLAQQFVGVSQTSPLKKLQAMNQACYDKVIESVLDGKHQVIVFVHSRKDTAKTANWIVEKLKEEEKELSFLLDQHEASSAVLEKESETVHDKDLKHLITHGIGIHHAGLHRNDRSLAEDLFADGLLKVLVSTATLAWGVNLPAHTVIIKGTDVYSPQLNQWVQLSPQDILQMLGRAGRPRYDTHGEGIVITNKEDVQYFVAVLNEQLPIESQMMGKLVDAVNAEIVIGNIKNIPDAISWLQTTYLYSRMLSDPQLYEVYTDRATAEENLSAYCEDLCHSAFTYLQEQELAVYKAVEGTIHATILGRISSFYYLRHDSVANYNTSLEKTFSLVELFSVFGQSAEFQYMAVREEEKYELKKLMDNTPIPVKDSLDEPSTKINVLLQSYISRLKLDGFALNADMVYINQNAGRLLKALFEIALQKKWSRISKLLLTTSLYVSRRMWLNNSPLRQFFTCPAEAITRMEASPLPFKAYLDLKTANEVGQALRLEKYGKTVYDLLKRFPKLKVSCSVQPITRSILKFDIELLPDWTWDSKYNGSVEKFWVFLEDVNGDNILYQDILNVSESSLGVESAITFTIQLPNDLQERLPPNYYISVISDTWLQCEYKIPVIFKDIILPKKFPSFTTLSNETLYGTENLNNGEFEKMFDFRNFNRMQSQVFETLYNSNENVLLCSSKGTGKTSMAFVAFLNHLRQNKGRAVYICPDQLKINHLLGLWKTRLSSLQDERKMSQFGSDAKLNIEIFSKNHLVLATPFQFESFTRRWKYRKNLQKLDLIIFDDAHEVSNPIFGSIYESLISRMVLMHTQLETNLRIVSLSNTLSNARDFGEWMGIPKTNIYNFSPTEKEGELIVHLKTHDSETIHIEHDLMCEEISSLVRAHVTPLVFVANRKDAIEMSKTLLLSLKKNDVASCMTEFSEQSLDDITDSLLKRSLRSSIGILYKGMNSKDLSTVLQLSDKLQVMIATKDVTALNIHSSFVFIRGTSYFQASENRSLDYSLNSLLEMVGCCSYNGAENNVGNVTILTTEKTKQYYSKFLSEGEPLESFFPFNLGEFLLSECSNGIVTSKSDIMEWITYSYFYRRIHANPSYYGVKDTSSIGLSAYLTELFEGVLKELAEARLLTIEDSELGTSTSEGPTENEESDPALVPSAGAVISSHYSLSLTTTESFMSNLPKINNISKFLEVLALSSEFDSLLTRSEDSSALYNLYTKLPIKITDFDSFHLSSPGFKVFVLLQAYFSRAPINADFQSDLKDILVIALRLVNAMVDFLSLYGKLSALLLMEFSQMLVQGCWHSDSPLAQIPHFYGNATLLEKCQEKHVDSVYGIMELEDEDRNEIMGFLDSPSKLAAVADFVNNYPNMEIECTTNILDGVGNANESYAASITLTRDDEPESLEAVSERYPDVKREEWWLALGIADSKTLLALKKVVMDKESKSFTLPFSLEKPGAYTLTAWAICDSYLHSDKELSFDIEIE